MAYSLRPRLLRETLLETVCDEENFGGEESDAEENCSDYEHSDDADEEDDSEGEVSDDELADELQETSKKALEKEDALDDVCLAKRLKAAGRPVTKLYGKGVGKNRFVWSKNQSSRQSGKN